MSPLILFGASSSLKKQLYFVLATLVAIMALPVGAVLSLTNIPLLGHSSSGPSNGIAYDEPADPNDDYDYGYCTYWAALRRIQIGDPIPGHWGDAINWDLNARLAGYLVDHTPTAGSIFQWPDAPGGLGHVALVEKVDPATGDWTISEMNAQGWNVEDEQTYPAKAAQDYNFIHDKESYF